MVGPADADGMPLSPRSAEEDTLRRATEQLAVAAREKDAVLAEFNAVIDNIEYGVLFMDSDLRARIVNRAFRDMWGMPDDFIERRPTMLDLMNFNRFNGIYEVRDADWEDYTQDRVAAVRRGNIPPTEFRRADGRVLQYQCIALPDGGRMLTYFDITKLKDHESELKLAKEQAEAANRSKSDFLANMSHELRTPLNAIIGFSEVIMREDFGPVGSGRYREYLKDIHASGTHLLSLINDILDLSKIEAGRLELHEDLVTVPDAVEACLRIIKERAAEADVALANDLPPVLPRLRCDERAVKQIVLNLLSNAVKFTPRGGQVTVSGGLDGHGDFFLRIADNGIGVAANDIPEVMAPFGQIASSMTRDHEGTGLGLPLVKSLMDSHQGTLDFSSEPGAGTTVTVTFPAARVEGGAASASEAGPE